MRVADFKCKGSAKTHVDGRVELLCSDHTCPELQSEQLVNAMMVSQAKAIARSTNQPLAQIYRTQYAKAPEECSSLSSAAKYLSTFQHIEKSLFNKRREQTPALPKTTNDIVLLEKYKTTSHDIRFLPFDTNDVDRILCFASDYQIDILKKSRCWHIDGTFKSSTIGYVQTLNVHAWYENEMYHCASLKLIF